jgi:hypothetical protein
MAIAMVMAFDKHILGWDSNPAQADDDPRYVE